LGDGRWQLRVFVGRDERGHIKQVSRNFKGTKREAETALARLVTDINRQKVATTPGGSLGEMLDRWLEVTAPDRSVYTLREHTRMVERNIKPAIGPLGLDQLRG
jgi:hypothetical protein